MKNWVVLHFKIWVGRTDKAETDIGLRVGQKHHFKGDCLVCNIDSWIPHRSIAPRAIRALSCICPSLSTIPEPIIKGCLHILKASI